MVSRSIPQQDGVSTPGLELLLLLRDCDRSRESIQEVRGSARPAAGAEVRRMDCGREGEG